jgi:hypothetical protein
MEEIFEQGNARLSLDLKIDDKWVEKQRTNCEISYCRLDRQRLK